MAETIEAPARKTTRIYVSLKDQKLPVIFSYHQLYKREQKEIESFVPLNTSDDSFYDNILKKAESYVPSEEDEGSDDENMPIGKRGDVYDFEDPFIDDSEMLMEEPEDYALPEYDGFFVYQGPLDGSEGVTNTEKKSSSRKSNNSKGKAAASSSIKKTDTKTSRNVKKTSEDSKQKKPSTTATTVTATTSKTSSSSDQSTTTTKKASETKKPSTTANTKKKSSNDKEELSVPSVHVDLTSDSETSEKKKSGTPALNTTNNNTSSTTTNNASSSSSAMELEPLDSEVEELINILRRDVRSDMFETKSKFPSALKPTVFKIGLIVLRKYKAIDDNVLSHLMTILPYNRFTLRKLLTTKSGQLRIDELQQEIDEMAIQLKRKIDSMMPEQIKAHNEKVAQYKEKQGKQANGDTNVNEEEAVGEKKFRCNEEVRMLLYEIMKADEQSVAVSNLIAHITKKPETAVAIGKARKMMYQRLLSCWPADWMNSYEMSRQYSQIKSKITPTKSKAAATVPSSSQSKTTSTPDRKRKRVTPQSSPDDAARKKAVVTSENMLPSPLKLNQPTIIDLDNEENHSYQQGSASMKIEDLISGPKQ